MQKTIRLNNEAVDYTLKTSQRAKRLRLAVYSNCLLVVTRPRWLGENQVESFLRAKAGWILAKLEYFKNHVPPVKIDPKEYGLNKEAAVQLTRRLLAEYNRFYNFSLNSVKIKNTKTRWGSCSRRGNLNFSYRLIFLPEDIARYIVVHELCHLREFNHSPRFWHLVAQTFPDYKEKRRKLRLIGYTN